MGSFIINVTRGEQYYLECRNIRGLKKRFKLPDAHANAYSINAVWNADGDRLLIASNKGANGPDIPQYLLIHNRGIVYHYSKWDKNKDYLMFDISQVPSGVVQLLLLDEKMNPLSERLVFNKANDQAKVLFSTDKKVYEKRDLVNSTIKLSDFEGNFTGGNISVSVTDDKDISVDYLTTITSSLLLSSELKGYIETPAYYLQDNKKASYMLDHLMMTHGWRRYNIPEVIKGNMEMPETPMEESREISGVVKDTYSGRPIDNTVVTMLTSTGEAESAETNEKGEFLFSGFEYADSMAYFIQLFNRKDNSDVEVMIKEEMFPVLKRIPYSSGEAVDDPERESEWERISELAQLQALSAESGREQESAQKSEEGGFLEKAEQRARYDEDMRLIQLDEVVITAERSEKKFEPRLNFYANISSDVTIRREDIEKRLAVNTEQLLKGINGVDVRANNDGEKEVFIKRLGGAPALLLLDGIVIADFNLIYSTFDIESVDIFQGTSAAIFGARGFDGVVSITTRTGTSEGVIDKKTPDFVTISPLGYQAPVEFYSPKYDTPNAKYLTSPDYRTTIFWKPDIVINENEEAHFEFYTSDFPSTYSIVIEGLSKDGQIIRHVEKIEVQ